MSASTTLTDRFGDDNAFAKPDSLTHSDVRNLAWAVDEATCQLAAFDKRIKSTRAALRKVRELKRQGL